LARYQNRRGIKIHWQDIRVCFAKHTLIKSSLVKLGLGPRPGPFPFYLYTGLDLAQLVCWARPIQPARLLVQTSNPSPFSFLFLFTCKRAWTVHACYRRRVLKMQGGGNWKWLTCFCSELERQDAGAGWSTPRSPFLLLVLSSLLLSFLFIFSLVFISVSSLFFWSPFFSLYFRPFFEFSVVPFIGIPSCYSSSLVKDRILRLCVLAGLGHQQSRHCWTGGGGFFPASMTCYWREQAEETVMEVVRDCRAFRWFDRRFFSFFLRELSCVF